MGRTLKKKRLVKMYLIAAAIGSLGFTSAHAIPIYTVVIDPNISWQDARSDAMAMGAGWDLAVITSAAENALIASLLPAGADSRDQFWLGGTDEAVEGTWEWVTGEAWVYTAWHGGEPNDSGPPPGPEDYLTMDYRGSWGLWNDANNNEGGIRGYVAEYTQVPEPGTAALFGIGLTIFGLTGGMARRRRRQ